MRRTVPPAARTLAGTALAAGVATGLAAGPPAPAAAQDEAATYEIVLDITWSAATAPVDFPADPHLSPLVAVTHTARYVLFRDGHTASSGLELVAENGRSATLAAELSEARRRGRVGTWVEGPALGEAPGRVSAVIEATADRALLSFVTMLAPSPDWFTGAADIALIEDGAWIDSAEATLWAWDSGTDAGATYTAPNADMQPRQSVRLLAGPWFLGPDGLTPVGTATIRRLTP